MGNNFDRAIGIDAIEEFFDSAARGAIIIAAGEGDAAAFVDLTGFVEPEGGADFKKVGAIGADGFVVADGLEQAGQQAGAQAGVGAADGGVSAKQSGLGGAEIVGELIGDE